jgi:hypothetical protein
MEITKEVKNLLEMVNSRVVQAPPAPQAKLTLPSKDLSLGELAELLSVLAREYNTTLPVLIRRLDRVSGDVRALDKIYTQKDDKAEWTQEEDGLLAKNPGLLVRWKGEESVDLRKRYLAAKSK